MVNRTSLYPEHLGHLGHPVPISTFLLYEECSHRQGNHPTSGAKCLNDDDGLRSVTLLR